VRASSLQSSPSEVERQDNTSSIVHHEFVPHGQTVNQVFYKDVLIRLREKIHKKRPEKCRTRTWALTTFSAFNS